MILIVDSGSTKTDWAVINEKKHVIYNSKGINPSSDIVISSLTEYNSELAEVAFKITCIHYYGAGVINQNTENKVRLWLQDNFKNCTSIRISSDLLGACKSLAGEKKGLISILGTGCNSCIYDGSKIIDNVPSLGYIISNEGGGTDIGKAILKEYFYRKMPNDVKKEFETNFTIDKSKVIYSLYQGENQTAYLAQFAKFINKTNNKEWRKSVLTPLFQSFIDIRIKSYFEYSSYELYFVGSIAYFCKDILKEILETNNLQMTKVIQKPIDGLISYHSQQT